MRLPPVPLPEPSRGSLNQPAAGPLKSARPRNACKLLKFKAIVSIRKKLDNDTLNVYYALRAEDTNQALGRSSFRSYSMSKIIGIDLGTTNSVVAVMQG